MMRAQYTDRINQTLAPFLVPMRKYLWDSITFPIWYPTGERILTWVVAPHCYWRLFSLAILGNTHTSLNLIFLTWKFDLFKGTDPASVILSSGLTFGIIPWYVTLLSLILGMYFTNKYQRDENGRIDPTWGPMSYIFRFAFVIFSLFTAYLPTG